VDIILWGGGKIITGYPVIIVIIVMVIIIAVTVMQAIAMLFTDVKSEDVAIDCTACIRRIEIMK